MNWQICGPVHDDSWRCPAGHVLGYDESSCRLCALSDEIAVALAAEGDEVLYTDRSVDL